MTADLIVRADFEGASEQAIDIALNNFEFYLRPTVRSRHRFSPSKRPRLTHRLDVPRPQKAEFVACVAFVRQANLVARDIAVEKLEHAILSNGLYPISRYELEAIYDVTVGEYLAIDDFVLGSCSCPCSAKKSDRLKVFALAVLLSIGGKGLEGSQVGKAVISEVSVSIDAGFRFTARIVDEVGQDFPVAVRREFEKAQCRVTLCLDTPRR